MQENYRILAVEDDDIFVERLRRHFAKTNLPVNLTRARDGLEAKQLLQDETAASEFSSCIILLDLRLPRMNGIEFLSWLRQSKKHSSTKVIVVTTTSSASEKEQVMALSANGFVSKSALRRDMTPLMDQIIEAYGEDGQPKLQTTPESLRNILAIEDDTIFRELIQRELGNSCTIHFAENLATARTHLGHHKFDCALVDLRLPDGDGLDLLPELLNQNIPAVILTAQGSEEIAVSAMKLGADDYLLKRSAVEGGIHRAIETAIEKFGLKRDFEAWERERGLLIDEYKVSLDRIKQLEGFLSICSKCNKIRDEGNQWVRLESYFMSHSQIQFSHGLCPPCFDEEMRNLDT